jgi:hypothetical protein
MTLLSTDVGPLATLMFSNLLSNRDG